MWVWWIDDGAYDCNQRNVWESPGRLLLHGAEMTEKQLMTEKQSVPVFGPCQVSCSSCPSAWDHMGRKRRNLWDCNNWWVGTLLEHNRDVGLIHGRKQSDWAFVHWVWGDVGERFQILFVWSDCQRAWEDVRTSFDEIHGQLDKPPQFNSSPLKKGIIPKRTGLFSNHHFSEAMCYFLCV